MSLAPLPTPTMTLQATRTPSITLSAPVIHLGSANPAPARMVREQATQPSHPVVEGTLLKYINGLLSDEGEFPEDGDRVTLVYFTPA